MRVLVTGGEGYIGSMLAQILLDVRYDVTVLDSCLYGRHVPDHPNLARVEADIRSKPTLRDAVRGADAVVHLAAIVGDAACNVDQEESRDINAVGTAAVALAAREAGVQRLIFASTCSVYGSQNRFADEGTPCKPLSIYAESKVDAERALCSLFPTRTVLRFGTLYGPSRRPRFDLAVNVMSARAAAGETVEVIGPRFWRAFTHVGDAAQAVMACLRAPIYDVAGQTFNVAFYNCTLHSLGLEIADCVRGSRVVERDAGDDVRTYQVSSARIMGVLGFQPLWGLRDGILQIVSEVRCGLDFRNARHDNAKWLRDVDPPSPRR